MIRWRRKLFCFGVFFFLHVIKGKIIPIFVSKQKQLKFVLIPVDLHTIQ